MATYRAGFLFALAMQSVAALAIAACSSVNEEGVGGTNDATAPQADGSSSSDAPGAPDSSSPNLVDGATTDATLSTADASSDGGMGTTVLIGPDGGAVSLGADGSALTLTVPAGALASDEPIEVTQTNQPCPVGFTCYSPVFAFGPTGTTFQQPVTVSLPFSGDTTRATLFWSYPNATGYQRVGGLPSGGVVTGTVNHFSTGFIADGVNYTQPADPSCVQTVAIAGRYSGETVDPVCFTTCSPTNGCHVQCPQGGALDAGVGCVSNCGDAGCQMGCPMTGAASALDGSVAPDAHAGVYPMIGSDGDGGTLGLGSTVALFFNVQDCEGRAVGQLDAGSFTVLENGNALSVEAQTTILPTKGITAFVELVLDVSAHSDSLRSEMLAGAKNFVQQLQVTDNLPVAVGIETLAGGKQITEQLAPTLDTSALLAKLDSLATFTDPDVNSTNLYGAVIQSLAHLDSVEFSYEQRNAGGAFGEGFAILFTDGLDTSGYFTQAQAVAAEQTDFKNQVIAVALQDSADYNLPTLTALTYGGRTLVNSPSPAVAESREFPYLATLIGGEINGAYLLGYCSPKRANANTVTVGVANTTNVLTDNLAFNASSFGPGCSASLFGAACEGWECGGLGCGGCNDQNSYCTTALYGAAGLDGGSALTPTGLVSLPAYRCESDCVLGRPSPGLEPGPVCGGETFTNLAGYSQTCSGVPAGGCVASLSGWRGSVQAMVVDANNVYWTASTSSGIAVERVARSGGAVTTLASESASHRTYGLAVDGNNLYWLDYNYGGNTGTTALMAVPLGGGTIATLASTTNSSLYVTSGAVAVGGNVVYVLVNNSLEQVPVAGGAFSPVLSGTTQVGTVTNIMADGSNLYFSANSPAAGSILFSQYTPSIWMLPLGGTTPTVMVNLTTMNSSVGSLPWTVAGGTLYWVDHTPTDGSTSYTIADVAVAGGPQKSLLTIPGAPSSLASDGSNVYWDSVQPIYPSGSQTTIDSVPATGGAQTSLVSGQNYGTGQLAASGGNLIWSATMASQGGSIMTFIP